MYEAALQTNKILLSDLIGWLDFQTRLSASGNWRNGENSKLLIIRLLHKSLN